MTAHDLTLRTLDYLRIRAWQGQVSEEELRGINGLAGFLVMIEEVQMVEPGTPYQSELIADSQREP